MKKWQTVKTNIIPETSKYLNIDLILDIKHYYYFDVIMVLLLI